MARNPKVATVRMLLRQKELQRNWGNWGKCGNGNHRRQSFGRNAVNAFTGYVRLDAGRWQAVCHAATRDECESLLLAADRQGAKTVDRIILPTSEKPRGRRERGRIDAGATTGDSK